MLASYSLIQLARPRPSSLRSILLDSSAVGRGLGQRGEMLVQRSKHVQGQKRWLSDEVPKEAPSSATEDASSSWETFRDVAGFLVLSIGSGGCKSCFPKSDLCRPLTITRYRAPLQTYFGTSRTSVCLKKRRRSRMMTSRSSAITPIVS